MKHVRQSLGGMAMIGVMAFALTGCGESATPVNERQRDPNAAKIKPPGPPSVGAGAVDDPSKSAPKPK